MTHNNFTILSPVTICHKCATFVGSTTFLSTRPFCSPFTKDNNTFFIRHICEPTISYCHGIIPRNYFINRHFGSSGTTTFRKTDHFFIKLREVLHDFWLEVFSSGINKELPFDTIIIISNKFLNFLHSFHFISNKSAICVTALSRFPFNRNIYPPIHFIRNAILYFFHITFVCVWFHVSILYNIII